MIQLLGLRSLIYPTQDIEADKAWWTRATGKPPYFDEPFYVGFNFGGYELGLHPDSPLSEGPISYMGVSNVHESYKQLLAAGATEHSGPEDVGSDIWMAVVKLPNGLLFGIIDNPHFKPEA